jgi:hypothetical protein
MKVTLVGSSGQFPPGPLDEPLPPPVDEPADPLDEPPDPLDEPPDPLDVLLPEASEGSPPDPLEEAGAGAELPLEQAVSPSSGTARAAPAVVDESS